MGKAVPKAKIKAEELWAEIGIMIRLDHPHIMRLYNTFEDDNFIYMASELCEGGEFFETIETVGHLHESVAAVVMKQILNAVSYLHTNFICHRDIKPENFLVLRKVDQQDLKKLQLKLIDFGTAKDFQENPMETKVCTPHYVAPEVLSRTTLRYTEKVDVWSCGFVLFMMLCGFMPFHHANEVEVLKLVKRGKYDFQPKKIWELISDTAKDLIKSMLCVKVAGRRTALEAYQHEWFKVDGAQNAKLDEEGMMKQMQKFVGMNKLKQMALQIIARNMSDSTIEQLRQVFMTIDADNSGTLTVEEMDEAMRTLNLEGEQRQRMKNILTGLDHDKTGSIAYTEFLAATMTQEQYMQEDACKAAFLLLDVDQDGYISGADVASFLSEKGKSDFGMNAHSFNIVVSIMRDCDKDGDGMIDWIEFMKLMKDDDESSERSGRFSASVFETGAQYGKVQSVNRRSYVKSDRGSVSAGRGKKWTRKSQFNEVLSESDEECI